MRVATLTLLVLARGAVAAPIMATEGAESSPAEPYHALVLDGALGSGAVDQGSVLAIDACLRLRGRSIEAGLIAGSWGQFLGPYDSGSLGAVAGYWLPFGPFAFELLGEAGVHQIEASNGRLLFSSEPDLRGTATFPYLGVRAGADLRLGGRVALVLGAWAVLRSDLGRRHIIASGRNLGAFGGGSAALQGRLGIEVAWGSPRY